MSWLHSVISRWFNSADPIEPPGSKDDGIPGAAGVHFDVPTLDICAVPHDKTDDMILSGKDKVDTFDSNDARFQRCIHIAENEQGLFLNHGEHRWALIVDSASGEVIRGYRWLRDEVSPPVVQPAAA